MGCALDFESLGLSGPSGVREDGPSMGIGLWVRTNKENGPNVANWAINGPLVGSRACLVLGLSYFDCGS